jgi:hypothetical protein
MLNVRLPTGKLMGLINLVYVSIATDTLNMDDLRDILAVSRRNNAELDITGMLLYREGFFIQVLEGEEKPVIALYEKIKGDKRHGNVMLVSQKPVSYRTFEQWSMGFNLFDETSGADIPGFTNFLQNPAMEYFSDFPTHAMMLLKSFQARSYI